MAKTDWEDGDSVNAASLNILGSEVNAAEEVQWYANFAAFPSSGQVTDKEYGARDTNLKYRWTGSTYAPINASSGGDVDGPSSAVNNGIALFDGATGKLIKQATQTGIIKATSGVIGTAAAGTDYLTPTGSETPTNKTINADNNTITNLEVDNFKASAVLTASEIASIDSDTALPTGALVVDYVAATAPSAVIRTVGTTASPISNAATVRPAGAAAVYWICVDGVTPTNAEDGDIIFNADP